MTELQSLVKQARQLREAIDEKSASLGPAAAMAAALLAAGSITAGSGAAAGWVADRFQPKYRRRPYASLAAGAIGGLPFGPLGGVLGQALLDRPQWKSVERDEANEILRRRIESLQLEQQHSDLLQRREAGEKKAGLEALAIPAVASALGGAGAAWLGDRFQPKYRRRPLASLGYGALWGLPFGMLGGIGTAALLRRPAWKPEDRYEPKPEKKDISDAGSERDKTTDDKSPKRKAVSSPAAKRKTVSSPAAKRKAADVLVEVLLQKQADALANILANPLYASAAGAGTGALGGLVLDRFRRKDKRSPATSALLGALTGGSLGLGVSTNLLGRQNASKLTDVGNAVEAVGDDVATVGRYAKENVGGLYDGLRRLTNLTARPAYAEMHDDLLRDIDIDRYIVNSQPPNAERLFDPPAQ